MTGKAAFVRTDVRHVLAPATCMEWGGLQIGVGAPPRHIQNKTVVGRAATRMALSIIDPEFFCTFLVFNAEY